jgi:AAA+ ATPase superfamily predicted ATPase
MLVSLIFRIILCAVISCGISIKAKEVINMNYSDPYFSGRNKEIKAIYQSLTQYKTIQINGVSGIGKTSLAAEFVKRNRNNYDVVWWINGRNDMLSQCSKFLTEIIAQGGYEIPEAILKASDDGMLSYIFKLFKTKKMLIIIDDIQNLQGSLSRIINNYNRSGNVHILITAQKSIPNIEQLTLSSFPLKESGSSAHIVVMETSVHKVYK